MSTRRELLAAAVERLRMARIDTPELDARVLLKAALLLSDAELIAAGEHPASPDGSTKLESMVARRVRGEPVARILGHREFWGMRFDLSPETLVPRPDTETLVEVAVAAFGRAGPQRVLDLGTGTGCLLIAILTEYPEARGVGTDIAPRAVECARNNAERLGMGRRAQFHLGDWDEGIDGEFDLIVSNPPYILRGDIAALAPEVRLHDPPLALDGGTDGLDCYRALAQAGSRRLAASGVLIAELGAGQEMAVAGIMREAGLHPDGSAHPDLSGVPRALVARH